MPTLPTLSENEWVSSPGIKVDHLLGYYLTNDPNRFAYWKDRVKSLQKTLATTSQKTTQEIRSAVFTDLTNLFERHYDEVNVKVTVEPMESISSLKITIAVDIVYEGKAYSVGREVSAIDGAVKRIIKLLNE